MEIIFKLQPPTVPLDLSTKARHLLELVSRDTPLRYDLSRVPLIQPIQKLMQRLQEILFSASLQESLDAPYRKVQS